MSATANRVIDAYLAECATADSGLRNVLADVDIPPDRLAAWRLLSRPLIVDHAELQAFGDDLARVFALVVDLPKRCFDGDLGRFCAALRIDERRARLMRRLDEGVPPMYGRSDMYYDGSSFRLLEFNIGSALGGLDLAGKLPGALLRVPAFAEFAAAHGLRHHDTAADIAEALRAAGKPVAAGDPVVAILEGPGGLASYAHSRHALAELMADHGLDCRVGEIGDLKYHNGKPYLDGTGVDVILRYFGLEEMLAHPDGEALLEPVFRAHDDGTAVLWTPMSSNLFGHKGTLAMLSEFAADSAVFSGAERELIDRVVPWSRMLGGPGAGADADVIDDCLARRETLVLKPTQMYGGRGVVIGREVDERSWREAVTEGATSGCVIQQEVRPDIEPVVDPETGERRDWYAVWGAFMTPAGFAGGHARAVPTSSSAVIAMASNKDARRACVFTC